MIKQNVPTDTRKDKYSYFGINVSKYRKDLYGENNKYKNKTLK